MSDIHLLTNNTRLQRQISFIIEIDRLKSIIRRSLLASGERLENSAEHSWHLAMMALILEEYANEPVDVARVIKMVLIHDIVEIDAGDTFIYDVAGNADKAAREQRAADRIYGLLPADQAAVLHALWQEFEKRQTADARFANVLDRLMPLMHNFVTEGRRWQHHGVVSDQVWQRNRSMAAGSEAIWTFTQALIQTAIDNGFLSEATKEA